MKGVYLDEFGLHHIIGGQAYELQKQIGNFIDLSKSKEDIEKSIIDINPDYIVASYHSKLKEIDLKKFDIPKLCTCGDSWRRFRDSKFKEIMENNEFTGFISRNNCDIFAYNDYLDGGYDSFWLPWSINPQLAKNYCIDKIYDFALVGRFSKYKYRREIDWIMSRNRHMKYLRREVEMVSEKQKGPYENYCMDINSSYITLGGCTQMDDYYKGKFIGNTFAKTIEIPACFSCLINSHWGDETALGFKDGENCIIFDGMEDFMEKLRYYLNDKEKLMSMTRSGYDLVHTKYTVGIVIKQFLCEVKEKYKL